MGDPGVLPEIYSYGHRNVYGMDWDPATGEMWASEFGPAGGDEINRIIPGHNYGWPLVSLGRHYTGSLVSDQPWYREGMDMPLFFWNPPFNPENMFFYAGDKFPRLSGSLLVAGAGSKTVAQMVFRGDFIKQGDTMLTELGVRFRDIRQGPDGYIYVLTEGRLRGPRDTDGMLLRLEPPTALDTATGPALDAPGREQLMAACTRCHGLDIVMNQRRTPQEWAQVMNTMIGSGLELTDVEYRSVLAYLTENLASAD